MTIRQHLNALRELEPDNSETITTILGHHPDPTKRLEMDRCEAIDHLARAFPALPWLATLETLSAERLSADILDDPAAVLYRDDDL